MNRRQTYRASAVGAIAAALAACTAVARLDDHFIQDDRDASVVDAAFEDRVPSEDAISESGADASIDARTDGDASIDALPDAVPDAVAADADAGVTFLPSSLPACALWLRADRGVTWDGGTPDGSVPVPSGGAATGWLDQCGEGDVSHDFAAPVPSGTDPDPFPKGTQLGGRPALHFDSPAPATPVGGRMRSGTWGTPLLPPVTYYVVFAGAPDYPATPGQVFGGEPGTSNHHLGVTNGIVQFAAQSATLDINQLVVADVRSKRALVTVVYTLNASSIAVKVVGATELSASFDADGGSVAQYGFSLGASTSNDANLRGDIAEVIVYRAAHGVADAERLAVTGYLRQRYNLQ